MNIKALQIHQLPKKHLRQRISRACRYNSYKKIISLFLLRYTTEHCSLCISRWRSLNRNSYPIFFSETFIQLNELNSNFPLYTTQNSCYGIPTSSETFFSLNFLSRKALISGFDFWNIIRYEKRCFWQVDNRRFLYYFHFSGVFFVVSLSLH